jgi:hypothetical protein
MAQDPNILTRLPHDIIVKIGGVELAAKTDLVFRALSVQGASAIIKLNWDGYLLDV